MSINKVLTSSGGSQVVSDDASLAAYFSLNRGVEATIIKKAVSDMINAASDDPEKIADIFALWMHTRDARGGKGERSISEEMCLALLEHYPKSTLKLLKLLPDQYGSWRDMTSLLSTVYNDNNNILSENSLLLKAEIIEMFRSRLFLDQKILESPIGSQPISLAGKWAPREKGKFNKCSKDISVACFPESSIPRKEYRCLVSKLNKKLLTCEVLMCEQSWSKLDPSRIPSKCLTSTRKAFMNEKLKGSGLRFPDNEDRNDCRNNFKQFLTNTPPNGKTLHGSATQPHELVKDYINQLLSQKEKPQAQEGEVEVDLIIEAQWKDLVRRLRSDLGEGLDQLVPVADMSTDTGLLPAVVAHAILASECAHPAFQNRVLTFAEDPKWLNFTPSTTKDEKEGEMNDNEKAEPITCSLLDKVKIMLEQRNRSKTVKDIEKAIDMMLGVCTGARLEVEEVSSLRLLILSDMSFESSWSTKGSEAIWSTQYENMCNEFKKVGYVSMPEIIYWNVSSKELSKGESFELPGLGNKLELELSSDSTSILCGACLAYDDDNNYIDSSNYSSRLGCNGSLKHSGDTIIDGKSKHKIYVDFNKLPSNVNSLFFSLCACGPSDLSHFKRPYINLSDGITQGNLCRYDLSDAGKAPSNLMAAVSKIPGGCWAITAIGDDAKTKCCGNYNEMMGMCSKRIPDVTMHSSASLSSNHGGDGAESSSSSSPLSLPASGQTPGVRLLCGFSADMLRCLIISEEEKEAIEVAVEAEKVAKEAAQKATALASINPNSTETKQALQKAEETAQVAKVAKVETSAGAKLRRTLRSERYQPVREILAEIKEGGLSSYVAPPIAC